MRMVDIIKVQSAVNATGFLKTYEAQPEVVRGADYVSQATCSRGATCHSCRYSGQSF